MNQKPSSIFLGEEYAVLAQLDCCVRDGPVRERIDAIVRQVEAALVSDRSRLMAWEPLPLTAFRETLPPPIRSSWVFILRAGVVTGAERHPNSHQRMMSYRGTADLQTGGAGRWESHPLVSDMNASLERRWVSVPPNVWHQAVVPAKNWVVVSFHTAAADELIEERPDPERGKAVLQKRYLRDKGLRLREFRPSDLACVRQLSHHTIDVCYAGVYPPHAVEFFKRFHSEKEILARSEGGQILVAELGEIAVATGALVGCEILGVFVDPQWQGCGQGRAMMDALENLAAQRGCPAVELSVSLPSKGFYEHLGYQIVEECSLDVGGGEELRFWKARKAIEIK